MSKYRDAIIRRTYKGKVVEYKTNKSALVPAYDRNFLLQTMLGKYYHPYDHDKEEGGCRDKLEFDIFDEGHHGKRNNHGRRYLL